MQILKELIDQMSLLVSLKITSPFEPENSIGGYHHSEQENYCLVAKRLFGPLKRSTTISKINDEIVTLSINDKNKGFAYTIKLSDGTLILLKTFPHYSQAFGKIVLSQPTVWDKPFEKAENALKFIEKLFGPITYYVATIDLAVHFKDYLIVDNDKHFLGGLVKKKKIFEEEYGTKFSGILAGTLHSKSRAPYMRLYDKSLDLRVNHGKPKPFSIYNFPVSKSDQIWNLEFHLNSRFLRSYSINSLNEVKIKIPHLWKYCTCEYIRLKVHSRESSDWKRSPTRNEWKILQGCFGANFVDFLERHKVDSADLTGLYKLNKLKKNLLGYAIANNLQLKELNDILNKLNERLNLPSTLKSLNWNDFVDSKMNKEEFQFNNSLEI